MNTKTPKLQLLPTEIIQKKKNNASLTKEELSWFISSYLNNEIPDYQMSALLMAINFNGMDLEETVNFTELLINSGEQLIFKNDGKQIVDKHSTGGVGDKVSLILGPILACMDYKIPMIAGRSLEHTGGTIDKLESISGFKVDIPLNQFQKNVNKIGLGMMGQSAEICPADGKIYALRDVTATVNSLPLICGSILSKKIAEGIQTLVMDIKTGNGAFMKNLEQSQKLGELMTEIGKHFNLKVHPVFTGMDQPLGKTAGLWCEVKESIDFLKGDYAKDLYNVTFRLFQQFNPTQNTKAVFDNLISSGKALNKFIEFIEIQGGDSSTIEQKIVHHPKFKKDCFLENNLYIESMDTRQIGFAIAQLGAGRPTKESKLDFSCGVEFHAKIGNKTDGNSPAFSVFGNNSDKLKIAVEKIKNAIQISPKPIKVYNPILN